MIKKVLIISPHFPPSNAADMQRVRMSLPYFGRFGWQAEIVTVARGQSDLPMDNLLSKSLPADLKIHYVAAFDKKLTSKFGLGSLALRSLLFYRRRVNQILKDSRFDLIYFSTTEFVVCVLGPYWKRRFNIPYVIDMQDPWHSEYYRGKPKQQRPAKYWFSYRLHRYLEPRAMNKVDGIISVSQSYIDDLQQRYPAICLVPAATIPFSASEQDITIAESNRARFNRLLDPATANLVYIGRGGNDMHRSISKLFNVFKTGLTIEPDIFSKMKMYFIGTSYAPADQAKQSVIPLANAFKIQDHVVEITDRISYFHALLTLKQATALFIPGSDAPGYTASKIYPYLSVEKPLLAIFNPESSAIQILKEYGVRHVFDFITVADNEILDFLRKVAKDEIVADEFDKEAMKKYSALTMTQKQCLIFDEVTHGKN